MVTAAAVAAAATLLLLSLEIACARYSAARMPALPVTEPTASKH